MQEGSADIGRGLLCRQEIVGDKLRTAVRDVDLQPAEPSAERARLYDHRLADAHRIARLLMRVPGNENVDARDGLGDPRRLGNRNVSDRNDEIDVLGTLWYSVGLQIVL